MSRHRLSNAGFYDRVTHNVKKIETDLEMLILATATGTAREALTEANILIGEASQKLMQARKEFNKDMGLT